MNGSQQRLKPSPSWMICGTGRELCLAKHDGHKAYLKAVEGLQASIVRNCEALRFRCPDGMNGHRKGTADMLRPFRLCLRF